MNSIIKVVLVALAFLTTWSFDSNTGAQSPTYQTVERGKLLDGNIPNGAWIETTAYTWITDNGARFNFNQPSARVPMHIDIGNIDAEVIRRLRSQCGSGSRGGLSGGCWATIRGQTAMLGDRQGIIARDIQLAPNPDGSP